MKKILFFAIALLCQSAFASASSTVNVDELAQYVYPNNYAASVSLNFMPDGLTYVKLSADGKKIEQFDVDSGKLVGTLLDVTTTRGDRKLDVIKAFTVSDDGTKMLVYEKSEQIYRRTFRAEYFIYDVKRNTLKPLSVNHPMQQSPVMSPDGRMVAFMAADNNIYIHKIDYGTEVAVTTDGKVNEIINGVPDWTCEEEFSTSRSMEWAPDNSMLCYLKYDESQVPAFSFAMYEGACNPMTQYALYPGNFTYKYPVAGEANSRVSLHSYDVDTRKTKDITLPAEDIEYIPRIHFSPKADKLIALALNREQNRLDFYAVNPRSTVVTQIHQERSNTWVRPEVYQSVAYEQNGMVIFSDRTGWSHLYRIDYNGNDLGALTEGEYDVTAYYGTLPDGSYYYQSAKNGAINRVITKVNARKKKVTDVSPAVGWAVASFSPTGAHYVMNHSSAQEPPVYTLVSSAKESVVRVLEDNAAVKAKFANVAQKEFFTFNSAGNDLNCWMIKPVDFDESKRYPVVIYQYSGPGSQEVTNRWSIDWMQYFAEQGYIVACTDGRGTGARGRDFEQCVYKNLGYYETKDQVAFLEYLQGLPYVDAKRVGIFGWSYGGYETLMAASSGAPYAAAVAVAAVTSWRFYDTIYAERYMNTPQANPDGYEKSAPLSCVNKLKCPLLLMSGTADDNVHMSNSIEYLAEMINQNRWPELLLFPNMNHSIYGCNTRAVVYSRMLEFFNRNIGK